MPIVCPYCKQTVNLKNPKPGRYSPKCPKCSKTFALLVPDDPNAAMTVRPIKSEPATEVTVAPPAAADPNATGAFMPTPQPVADPNATGAFLATADPNATGAHMEAPVDPNATGAHIEVPLEAIYRAALETEPRPIRRILEGSTKSKGERTL